MKRVRGFAVMLALLVSGAGSAGTATPAQFPQSKQAVVSADKKYSIYNENSDEEPNHSLYIENSASGARRKILDYGRHVDVMWAPSSDAFFVNDWSGSSEATCLVFGAEELKRLDVVDLLKGVVEQDILDSDHLYVTCEKWNKDAIVVKVSGRGDQYPDGFDRKYLVTPSKQQARRIR